MKPILLVCLLLACPTVALAQAPVVPSPYNVAFCWDQKDNGTVPAPAVGPFEVVVTIDTTARPSIPLPSATGAAGTGGCPTGSFPYLLTGYTSPKGNHTATVTLSNAAGPGLPSSPPFAFVIGAPPGSPTNVVAKP